MFCREKLKNEENPEKRMKIKRNIILISIILLVVIAGAFTVNRFFVIKNNELPPISQQNQSLPIWPMFQYDARHTGQCPYDTSKNKGKLKWKFKTDGWICFFPVISSDGTIYVGSRDGYLYAIGGK
jgi:outer membrane protein assembly factor BamB